MKKRDAIKIIKEMIFVAIETYTSEEYVEALRFAVDYMEHK